MALRIVLGLIFWVVMVTLRWRYIKKNGTFVRGLMGRSPTPRSKPSDDLLRAGEDPGPSPSDYPGWS